MTNLNIFDNDLEEIDVSGATGGGSYLMESGIYALRIQHAYIETNANTGSINFVVTAENTDGVTITDRFCVFSGRTKSNEYVDKRDGTSKKLPSYLLAKSLGIVVLNKILGPDDYEDKVINVRDWSTGKDVPKTVPMATELVGKFVKAAVIKEIRDKNSLNQQTGRYEPTGETREENHIVRFYNADTGMAASEMKAHQSDPSVQAKAMETWAEKNTGKTIDKATRKAAAPAPQAAAPMGESAAPSLFAR